MEKWSISAITIYQHKTFNTNSAICQAIFLNFLKPNPSIGWPKYSKTERAILDSVPEHVQLDIQISQQGKAYWIQ